MRAWNPRTALLLGALALTVPASVGATAPEASGTAAENRSGVLCSPLTPCVRPSVPGPGAGPTPKAPPTPPSPVDPGPAKPEPTEPGPGELGPGDPGPTETPSESPTESPTPSESPSAPAPVEATDDDNAPIFTSTPASMGSESLSFTGLSGIRIVNVPTADGGSVRALKISADSITINGFSLTVRHHDEPGLVTKADTMKLEGDVEVYLGSVTATTKNGDSLTIGTDTPPPLDDVEPGLLRVTMGLVGTTADSITYSNTDQKIVDP